MLLFKSTVAFGCVMGGTEEEIHYTVRMSPHTI